MTTEEAARIATRKYTPGQTAPLRVSRSRIEAFVRCPRCFLLDIRHGVGQPPSPPFSLNNAVDLLLKKEFDILRDRGEKHRLMEQYGIDAVPFAHPKMEEWRDARRRGILHYHQETNLLVTGGVDDVWVMPDGQLIIADYKATSKDTAVTLDAEWQDSYRRQVEVYQWLFRGNGFTVSDTAYFVYCNGRQDRKRFDAKLEFDITVLPHVGSDTWIPKTLAAMRASLDAPLPPAVDTCAFCAYRRAAHDAETKGTWVTQDRLI